MYDVLVLGSGIAGLTTALHAAARGMSVLVLTKGELSHSATRYAQGGVAAALAEPDSPDLHLADTLARRRRTVRRRRGARARHRRPGARARARRARRPLRHRRATAPARRCCSRARAATRSRGSCTPAATRPAPRSSGRSWPPSSPHADRGARRLVRDRADRRGRALRAAYARSDPTERSRRSAPTTPCSRPAASGQCFAVTTNPTLSTGDGIALALAAGCRVRRPRVRAVPPDRAAPPVDAAAAALGGAARRRCGAPRRRRRRVHDRRAPARRSRAARRRLARDPPAHARDAVPTTCASTRR